ncbi:non-oxidative hydroxyarylic acid decarboxylases subunit D [Immundisolibacter sp.]|uniref:non-oxidative hydroxyarylic acid decarboxylases subunit D n=1 Tax=Immundisolibacter sp. TaxID=1934948 RepID=UPI00356906C1
MALNCPRCGGDQNRVEHQGKENGTVIWTVHYCTACCFTWRDTEPALSIDPAKRRKVFQIDPSHPERFGVVIPVVPR